MTDERTEEAAISGLLTLTVGGRPVELRVLSIEESDAWQKTLGVTIGKLDIPEATEDGGVFIGNMLIAGSAAKLDMVLAYDVDGKLGSRDSVRKRMTKSELASALEAILDAENPKEEAANRSVVEAFGRPNLMIQLGLTAVQKAATSVLANITNGRLPSGGSIPDLFEADSPTSSSSSSGPTGRSELPEKPKRQRSKPKSQERTPIAMQP